MNNINIIFTTNHQNNKTMKKLISLMIILFAVYGYSQKPLSVDADATASYVPPNFIGSDENFEISTGAFFFDATKRMGVFNVFKNTDGTFQFKYLGEEQPDAIFETIKDFLTNASVNIKDNISVDAEMSSLVEKLVAQLTTKSNSLNFLRTALYRLNESAYNEDIDSDAYAKLYEIIITTSAELQKQELLTYVKE